MCAHDQRSIFSTVQEFRPDYGLLLELRAFVKSKAHRAWPSCPFLCALCVVYSECGTHRFKKMTATTMTMTTLTTPIRAMSTSVTATPTVAM